MTEFGWLLILQNRYFEKANRSKSFFYGIHQFRAKGSATPNCTGSRHIISLRGGGGQSWPME
jgi:hypothetical protein